MGDLLFNKKGLFCS